MNHMLLQPYTPDEVRSALFQKHLSKSPRPDGMSPFFFQKYWAIVRLDVRKAVLSVLHSGHCFAENEFYPHCFDSQKKMKHNICLITAPLVWKMWSLE